MTPWARAPEHRHPMVPYSVQSDAVIDVDHLARLLDGILECWDWTAWESHYHERLGQPPNHPGQRPVAMIKQTFGLRHFPLRGLERVRVEFRWAALAFELQRILSLLRSQAGPDGGTILPTHERSPFEEFDCPHLTPAISAQTRVRGPEGKPPLCRFSATKSTDRGAAG